MLEYKAAEHQLAYNNKQKQREAWRAYAKDALRTNLEYKGLPLQDVKGWVVDFADQMMAEENKRFGGDDENL